MAQMKSLGKITVASAGTPVQVTSDASIVAAQVVIVPDPATTGATMYVGTAGLNKATGANLLKALIKPAAGVVEEFRTDAVESGKPLRPFDLWIDAAASGDGCFAYYVVQ